MGSGECPYCKGRTDAEFVDVGVGHVQVTAYQCGDCLAVQMGHPDEDRSKATAEERKVGWWRGPPWMYEGWNPYEKEPEDLEHIKAVLLAPHEPRVPTLRRRRSFDG